MDNKKLNLGDLKSINGGWSLEGAQRQEAERIYQGLKNGELDINNIYQLHDDFSRAQYSVKHDPNLNEQEKREKFFEMRDQARIYGAALAVYNGQRSNF